MIPPSLPAELIAALDAKLHGLSRNAAAARAAAISQGYRAGGNSGAIRNDSEALAYALARMPATYAAVIASLSALRETHPDFAPASLLDIGAGPGTAAWAAAQAFSSLREFTLVDCNAALRALALELFHGSARLQQSTYIHGNARELVAKAQPADLVIASYLVGEMSDAEQTALAEAAWMKTRDTLVIVEPGTPAGYARIIALRRQLIARSAHVAAPCPHDAECPLVAPDWCHFVQRLPRSRAHIALKEASLPYEDEKIFIRRADAQARGSRDRLPVAAKRGRVADHRRVLQKRDQPARHPQGRFRAGAPDRRCEGADRASRRIGGDGPVSGLSFALALSLGTAAPAATIPTLAVDQTALAEPAAAPALPQSAPAAPPALSGGHRVHTPGDPLEGFNRPMFGLFRTLDKAIIRPLAMGYKHVVPKPLRDGIRNVIANLGEPVTFLNDTLQLRPQRAGRTLTRFVLNSTIGIGGVLDMGRRGQLPRRSNGFGNTLAYYGVGPGPYIFLPLVGPNTLRDLLGTTGDGMVLPTVVGHPFDQWRYRIPRIVLGGLDARVEQDDALKSLFAGALDPYATLRSSYLQNRASEVRSVKAKGLDEGEDVADPADLLDDPGADPALKDPLIDPAAPAPATTPAVTGSYERPAFLGPSSAGSKISAQISVQTRDSISTFPMLAVPGWRDSQRLPNAVPVASALNSTARASAD